MARPMAGRPYLGSRRRLQPGRLWRRAVPVLRRLDAPDRSVVRPRDRLPPAPAGATVVRAGRRRGTPVPPVVPARRTRPRLTACPSMAGLRVCKSHKLPGDLPMNLVPTAELIKLSHMRFPNESDDYRRARHALLAEEIELRRHIERVAEQRRALPPGGEVTGDYRFTGEHGETDFAGLFGDKQTLVIYSWMFGPQRQRPCPMCTALLSALEGEARDIEQNVALAVTARSPIERLVAFKRERGWRNLKVYSDGSGDYTRAYVNPDDGDTPAFNVFTRRDGTIRHFWAGEMFATPPDPGQDPRGAPDLMPLWNVLDLTPEGRQPTWYPKLEYGDGTHASGLSAPARRGTIGGCAATCYACRHDAEPRHETQKERKSWHPRKP